MQFKNLIITLIVSCNVLANEPVTDFSHWLPSVQSDLFSRIQQAQGTDLDTVDKIAQDNKFALKKLNKKSWKSSHRKKYVSDIIAKDLLRRSRKDPVIGPLGYGTYDPQSIYGFCFGRATWVWLEALKAGLDKQSIKKVFLIGPMKTGTVDWQFHVATAIRSRGIFSDTWLVIDPNFDRVLTVEEFLNHYSAYSTDDKLRMVITDPQRLGPSSTIKFGPAHYKNNHNDENYNRYFQDMLENFSKNIKYEKTKQCKYLF